MNPPATQVDTKLLMPISRRSALLGIAGSLAGASLLGACAKSAGTASTNGGVAGAAAGRSVRIAHMTDLHIQPEKGATKGVAKCLSAIAALSPRPECIVTGGDLCFDLSAVGHPRAQALLDLLGKTFRNHAPCPVRHTLGNHDSWGWNKAKSGTTGNEIGWGKQWSMETLGLASPFHRFDVGAWRVFCLDSIRPKAPDAYEAYLDDAQHAWLAAELAALPSDRFAMIVSHVPIVSVCALFTTAKTESLVVANSKVHRDGRRLHELFVAHPRVRLAVSGHIHQNERIDYKGLTYICAGAVCGSWWDGPKDRCDEGFSIFDLHADGSFDQRYVPYGWQAQA